MDSFDDIWRNRFNEGNVPESDWNTPDDSVWQGINAHIQQEKKRRKILLFWLLSGLVALLLLIASLTHFGVEKVEESKQVSSTENMGISSIARKSTDSNLIIPLFDKKESSSTETDAFVQTIDIEKEASFNSKKNIESENNPIIGAPLNSAVQNQQSTLAFIEKESKTEQKSNDNLNTINEHPVNEEHTTESIRQAIWIIESLPLLEIDLQFEKENKTSPEDLEITTEEPILKNRKAMLSLYGGSIYMDHRISDDYTEDLSPFDFNYSNQIGWQAGIQVALPLNKWMDGFTGFQYERLKSTSGHNSELNYNPALEIAGETNNNYDVNLATPYGLSDASFILTRSNDIGQDDVEMLVDFESNHTITNLSMPLGIILYPVGKDKKIQPVATLGVGVNYLTKATNQIKKIQTHHDAIQYSDHSNTMYTSPQLQSWHFDYRLGAGVNYSLNTNTQVQLNYSWNRGINPVFDQDKYQTRIDRHQLTLGLARVF